MNSVCKDIFRAVFEDKWLNIEYRNQQGTLTYYWIGIKSVIINSNISLVVDGLHVVYGTVKEFTIALNSIKSSSVIEGSYYGEGEKLKEDIENNPDKYKIMFNDVANLKILNYLAECSRLDNTPYRTDYSLLKCFDGEKIKNGDYTLTDNQYMEIIRNFHYADKKKSYSNYKQLCLNILSINTKKGLYVLAYQQLNFDVKNKCFRPENEIKICQEYRLEGFVQSIRYFLSEDDLYLLNDFRNNINQIEDSILKNGRMDCQIDDMPYLIAIERDIKVDLDNEFSSINKQFENNKVAVPIKAFFGQLTKEPPKRKEYPVALLDNKVNLDQLLAIQHAVKYPITYVQGPPGTGKTNTIINTIITEFINGKTILFSSYNNHPLDSVYSKLLSIENHGKIIDFPVLRIGNSELNKETLERLNDIFNKVSECEKVTNEYLVFSGSDGLSSLMKKYEAILELQERKEALETMLEKINGTNLNFQIELSAGQLDTVRRKLEEYGEIKNEDALKYVKDFAEIKEILEKRCIQRLSRLRNKEYEALKRICSIEEETERNIEFNRFISNDDNLKLIQKAFPVIISTCISAHHLGSPAVHFDITIMDEAGQCNNAISLVPIIRGEKMMLVGDPQQLKPVIVLDKKDNEVLKKKYQVPDEYDYIDNSIYKTMLTADSVCQEILLSHHYRCDKKIIDFCNRKYYNGKLKIDTVYKSANPLLFINVKDGNSTVKNSLEAEADAVIDFIKANNNGQSIGIITPFVNQKKLLEEKLKDNQINNVTCGTIHAYQGDEKDIMLFSLAISDKTVMKTYQWVKNNKELINVAVSRSKKQLVVIGNERNINRLHALINDESDDLYELVNYAKTQGNSEISTQKASYRALGIKPYKTETEEAFFTNLNHCLDNIFTTERKCIIQKEVPISQVFDNNYDYNSLFYTGRFDFVIYERGYDNKEWPVLAIELDGREHYSEESVKIRDEKKNEICAQHGFNMIRVDNSYARRYNYMKEILINYFQKKQ